MGKRAPDCELGGPYEADPGDWFRAPIDSKGTIAWHGYLKAGVWETLPDTTLEGVD